MVYSFSTDIEKPVIESDLTIVIKEANAESWTASVTWQEPSITDNSGSFTLTSNFASGDILPRGNTEVTYTAIDAAGNQEMFSFNVIVNGVKKRAELYITNSPDTATDSGVTVINNVSSRIRCARHCMGSSRCVSFSFDSFNKRCVLNKNDSNFIVDTSTGARHYAKNLSA